MDIVEIIKDSERGIALDDIRKELAVAEKMIVITVNRIDGGLRLHATTFSVAGQEEYLGILSLARQTPPIVKIKRPED